MESGKLVFLVEDDQYIREALRDVLELEGYRVLEASNGQEGIDLLRENPDVSLILLDLMMPVKDGFYFRAEQMQDPELSKIPVVIMSADAHVEEKSAKLGVKQVLRKPLEIEIFLKAVETNSL